LVKTLKQEIGIPIHFHTHDTAGVQSASILKATDVGLDIADAAMAPMSGGTSQPNLNTLVESLHYMPRETGLCGDSLDQIARYWTAVRHFYTAFESEALPGTADLYSHEMPGGQYTNLYQQASALGLAEQWPDVCHAYAQVNQLFGDIVKVTPTSKAVGDMALFMVANGLTCEDVLDPERELAFPASVIDLIGGRMGQPPGGFPQQVKDRVLRGGEEFTERPGELLPPADFAAAAEKIKPLLNREPTKREVVTYLLYPKVYEEYVQHVNTYSDTSVLPTHAFFYGQDSDEEISVEIEEGKILFIKYLMFGDPHPDGKRTVFFELNGQPRDVAVIDHSLETESQRRAKADSGDPKQVGASMPGMVVSVTVQVGDVVAKGQKILSLEAMKMESTVYAERDGKVSEVLVEPGSQVETGDLMLRFE
jgi:pyruvate carboxylase